MVGWEESVQLEGSTLKKAKSFDPVVESSREVVDTSPVGAGVVEGEFKPESMGGVIWFVLGRQLESRGHLGGWCGRAVLSWSPLGSFWDQNETGLGRICLSLFSQFV